LENINTINLEIAKAELELKQIQVLSKKKALENPTKRRKLTIEQATIFVAIIAFIGSFLGTFLQGCFSQKQQRREFESTLIINAIETGYSDASKKNLKFLLDAGIISEKEKEIKLSAIISDTTYRITGGITHNSQAYICLNPNAFAYHIESQCQSPLRCSDSVLKVSVFEAEFKYGRRPCNFCF
jgi:hypothetical protein